MPLDFIEFFNNSRSLVMYSVFSLITEIDKGMRNLNLDYYIDLYHRLKHSYQVVRSGSIFIRIRNQ